MDEITKTIIPDGGFGDYMVTVAVLLPEMLDITAVCLLVFSNN